MELKNIDYFLAIAGELSLSKAAEKLYVSQSALSKYLTRLEASIGTALFIRYNNSLSLTPAGEAYRDGALAVMDVSRTVDKKLSDLIEEREYTLSIGVTGERSQRFLGGLLLSLYEKYTPLHVRVLESPASELAQMLKRGELDLAIYAVSGPDSELTQLIIRREEVVLAVPARQAVRNGCARAYRASGISGRFLRAFEEKHSHAPDMRGVLRQARLSPQWGHRNERKLLQHGVRGQRDRHRLLPLPLQLPF